VTFELPSRDHDISQYWAALSCHLCLADLYPDPWGGNGKTRGQERAEASPGS